MKSRKDFLRTVSASSVQGGQPLPRIPIVEICGNRRVLIENHQGILSYNEGEILVKVCFGMISVTGDALCLCRLSKEQLAITGNVFGIVFKRRE